MASEFPALDLTEDTLRKLGQTLQEYLVRHHEFGMGVATTQRTPLLANFGGQDSSLWDFPTSLPPEGVPFANKQGNSLRPMKGMGQQLFEGLISGSKNINTGQDWMENLSGMLKGLSGMLGGSIGKVKGGGAAGLLETAGTSVGALGASSAAAGVFSLAAAAVVAVDKLHQWSRALYDSNVQYAEFSAAMANVKAHQEMRDIELSRMKGDALAPSAEGLARSMNKFEKAIAPIEIGVKTVFNKVAEFALEIAADVINAPSNYFNIGRILAQRARAGVSEEDVQALEDQMFETTRRLEARGGPTALERYDWSQIYGRPARFPPD